MGPRVPASTRIGNTKKNLLPPQSVNLRIIALTPPIANVFIRYIENDAIPTTPNQCEPLSHPNLTKPCSAGIDRVPRTKFPNRDSGWSMVINPMTKNAENQIHIRFRY